jgi:hypothetical protein
LEDTRTSAGTAVVVVVAAVLVVIVVIVVVVVVVVVVVELGMTKYCPIARRTAPFAALAMPPSIIVGAVTSPPFNAGGRFLYYMRHKRKENVSASENRGMCMCVGERG